MAKAHGIHGFCYYHYWFNGKRVLEEPLNRKLKNKEEDLPFMLCWANENWTRAWDGGDTKILLEQNYCHEVDVNHINSLLPYFKDERYIKVDGKPVFIIYKDSSFPDTTKTINTFREEAAKYGIELYLCRFDRAIGTLPDSATDLGFDAAFEFQPLSKARIIYKNKHLRANMFKNYVCHMLKLPFSFNARIDYKTFIDLDLNSPNPGYKCFPGVSPGWDNSSRRPVGKATIFEGSTPDKFKYWLSKKLQNFEPYSNEENFLMINAWNEWAEGNHMEPCKKWGLQFLEALNDEVSNYNK